MLEITKFSCIDNSLQCYNENKDCEEAIVEQIAAEHQTTSEQETDQDDMTKVSMRITRMLGNLLLDYHCISFRKALKAALYLH
jgi:hypothetical protein